MPQLTGNSKYLAKDQAKSDRATKFIGRGSSRSSTHRYMLAWGKLANCKAREYTRKDIVFISAEGNRLERVSPPWISIQTAMREGVTFITDIQADRERPYNIGERQVAEFLEVGGYVEVTPGTWKPRNPLEFLRCEMCKALTENNQDESEEPDSLDLCPHCKDKNGK